MDDTTRKSGNKKTARDVVVDDDEGENDTKRHRTDDANTAASINHKDSQQDPVVPAPVFSAPASATGTGTGSGDVAAVTATAAVTTTTNNNDNDEDDDDDDLPSTTSELMEVLCSITSDRYTREEALYTLVRLSKWAETENGNFLKSFHACNGGLIVLNFIKKTMNDGNCVGQVRMECIEKAAQVVREVTYSVYENQVNFEIETKIAASIMECDGITTLINASEEYNGGEDVPELNALCFVWKALDNITAFGNNMIKEDGINEDQTIGLFDTGIDVISQLKSVDSDVASETLEFVFGVLDNCIKFLRNFVTTKYFQDKDALSKCLEVFKMDDDGDTWTCRSENTMEATILFFYTCYSKALLDRSSDCEILLPLLVMVLKVYPSNDGIRHKAMCVIRHACSIVNDRKTIERSGAVEVLGALLASDNIHEVDKHTVRCLTHMITKP
ncbi:hypothetical protein FRACYDRAFT_236523 [Fragilariopsis cylindrus CCMP1102]|uniref:ARM repeat-containing protein n=1 Tax=Fragilariopsis cylindrus CCMP1102 TaxID=635003 RepID=A0A1E7FJA1_9STRA|nr:hypothetical protein FRACYDRAFT_236523 [Fragilariopsis cylindrus CCMP1102]|eukprot:OEU18250.1 hypothetical protein FRACYDRAFT_236523 [Fragilariopsis cylindrus CCMP1102]